MDDFITDVFASLLSPRDQAARLQGKMLGHWKLVEKISEGEGGIGVIYRATHTQPAMGEAAIKVLAIDVSDDPETRELFEREIAIHKKISNSNGVDRVVRILDAEVYNETLPWFAMTLVKGKSLDHWLRKERAGGRRVSTNDVVSIACDVLLALEGLHAAALPHQSGLPTGATIVHCDIKPGNVMVQEDDGVVRAMLIDFGIASIFEPPGGDAPAIDVTQTRMAIAQTPEYASPEMRVPYPKLLDARSDIFQVGLLCYEMMTGARYWLDWPKTAIRIAKATYPRWLRNGVQKAVEWDRARRFQNASSFAAYLQHPWRISLGHRRRRIIVCCCVILFVSSMAGWVVWRTVYPIRTAKARSEANLHDAQEKLAASEKELSFDQRQIQSLQQVLDLLRKQIQSKPQPTEADAQAVFIELRQFYKRLDSGHLSLSDVVRFRERTAYFIGIYPDKPASAEIKMLSEWLTAAIGGSVRITIREFNESKYLGRNWNLRYTIDTSNLRENLSKSNEYVVTRKVQVNESLDVPWVPQGQVTVTIENKDKERSGSTTFGLASDAVLQADPNSWHELRTSGDGNFKLWYTVERVGFGPLPPFPE